VPDQFQPSSSIRDELDFVTFGDKNSPYGLLQSLISKRVCLDSSTFLTVARSRSLPTWSVRQWTCTARSQKRLFSVGHEASGHGQSWTAQFSMTPEEERASYQQSIESIERATGTRPVGFNAFWLRGTPHTLEILQSLGFIYHIDDVSRDEPFLINVRDKPFTVVPDTLHMNDIVDYETRYFSTAMYTISRRNSTRFMLRLERGVA
jgi:peptidoglycan/xylan/chitin deacetylase (PgdA/CDA1 family)